MAEDNQGKSSLTFTDQRSPTHPHTSSQNPRIPSLVGLQFVNQLRTSWTTSYSEVEREASQKRYGCDGRELVSGRDCSKRQSPSFCGSPRTFRISFRPGNLNNIVQWFILKVRLGISSRLRAPIDDHTLIVAERARNKKGLQRQQCSAILQYTSHISEGHGKISIQILCSGLIKGPFLIRGTFKGMRFRNLWFWTVLRDKNSSV